MDCRGDTGVARESLYCGARQPCPSRLKSSFDSDGALPLHIRYGDGKLPILMLQRRTPQVASLHNRCDL
jgi:hypothetical protein